MHPILSSSSLLLRLLFVATLALFSTVEGFVTQRPVIRSRYCIIRESDINSAAAAPPSTPPCRLTTSNITPFVQEPSSTTTTTTALSSSTSTILEKIGLKSATSPIRQALHLLSTFFSTMIFFIRRSLYPNATPDPSLSEPLPPGPMGCPLLGNQMLIGSRKFGVGYFYHKMSKVLGNPSVWKSYFLSKPMGVIVGGKRIKGFLMQEFDPEGIEVPVQPSSLMGDEGLLSEKDRSRHAFLRRLVGQAMTPAAVTAAIPNLQEVAETRLKGAVTKLSAGGSSMTAEQVCTEYTLDVAWKQILGLDLDTEEEIKTFEMMVDQWIGGIVDPRLAIGIGKKGHPAYDAKDYLVQKIEEKIDRLEQNGPDSSTLSGMVYATDDDDDDDGNNGTTTRRKLTRQQVIDNSLLLILAGSETSASTLTNAILCLGLNPDCWTKIVSEQRALEAKYGSELTRAALDEECPYLDATIREVMRIKPITSGAPRVLRTSQTFDGYQIPKNWLVNWNILLTHEQDPVTFREDGSHMDVTKGFKPERWLDETTRPTTEFIPMGAGPRYCLGATLAYAEMKVFLAVLARMGELELVRSGSGGSVSEKEGRDRVLWKRMSIIPQPLDGVPFRLKSEREAAVM